MPNENANDKRSSSLKSGECPICTSERIKSGADVPNKHGLRGSNRIPIDMQMTVALDNYVCIDCGYVESYITDRGMLNRIEKHWRKVSLTHD